MSLFYILLRFQNMQWSFGMTKGVPVINLTDEHRKMVAYACAHTAVLYDFANNKQYLLEGHVSDVSIIHHSN